MAKNLFISLCLIFFLSMGEKSLAQSSVHSSSAEGSSTSGSVSFSVGQITHLSDSASNGSIHGGVQVPIEIHLYQSVEDPLVDITLRAKAYPNPVSNLLNLKIESEELNDLNYRIFDMNGKLILNESVENNITEVDMSSIPSGTYFLTVFSETNNKQYDTFKIIKN